MEWKGLDPPTSELASLVWEHPGAAVGPSGHGCLGKHVLLLMLFAAAEGLLPHAAAWQAKPAVTPALAAVRGS